MIDSVDDMSKADPRRYSSFQPHCGILHYKQRAGVHSNREWHSFRRVIRPRAETAMRYIYAMSNTAKMYSHSAVMKCQYQAVMSTTTRRLSRGLCSSVVATPA